MPLLDLSLVTKTLTNLLEFYFKSSRIWNTNTGTCLSPAISPEPPDELDIDVVGIYLYHISEDSTYKNLPPKGNDIPPVRFIPMGLNLFYQLTAKSSSDGTGTLKEQKMMGIAIKALHDYPVIDSGTSITDLCNSKNKIFPSDLDSNEDRFRIVLQPIAHNEAMNYWSAGNKPPRLAAYYQVSVVLLEPEETKSRSSNVLVYGVQTFVDGAPRIDSCKNTISFTIPTETEPRMIDQIPAQAPPSITLPPGSIPISHKVNFMGTGFKVGNTALLLKNERWENPEEVDSSWWQLTVTNDGLNAVIRETLKPGGKVILPGIYSAIAKVTKQFTLPDGSTRNIEHLSNQCPFAVSPRIDSIGTLDNNKVSVIKGYVFQNTDLKSDAILVYYGNNRLGLKTTAVLNHGEFRITDSTTLEVRLPDIEADGKPLKSGNQYPIRIFVNGVESSPNWIQYP